MKIGAFCEIFSCTPSAVRYYVKEGLLVPEIKNKQYVFNQACISDMRYILSLKEYGFSVHEIYDILSLYRISNFAAASDIERLRQFYIKKEAELERKRKTTEKILCQIRKVMEQVDVR